MSPHGKDGCLCVFSDQDVDCPVHGLQAHYRAKPKPRQRRIKWPSVANRRARAVAFNASWANPAISKLDAELRNRVNWMSGYESAMRDARRALNGRGE